MALHASGNYFIAAFNSYINCYNIYPKKIQHYNTLEIKTCEEMKFS